MGWRCCKLIDISAKKRWALNGGPFGSNLTTKDYTDAGVPVIRGTNLAGPTKFSFDDFVYVSEAKADELLPNNANPGDLVFTQRGTIGQVGLIPLNSPYSRFVISQSQMKLTADPTQVYALFLYYYFLAPTTVEKVKNLAFSAGVPHINLDILRKIEVPVPPLPVQRRIAGILSAYDALIENNLRRIRILEEMARSIYREWFVNFRFPGHEKVSRVESPLDSIPEGWEVTTFGELYNTGSGGTPSRRHPEYFEGGSVNWVKSQELLDSFILSTEERITNQALQDSSAKLFPTNTVLIALYGATIGKLAILASEAATNQACCAVIPKRSAFGKEFAFLTLLLNRERIIGLRLGAAQQNISQVLLRNFESVKPPDDLVSQFSSHTAPLFDGILTIQRQIQNLRQTRDLLLPRLLSGTVNVSDADSADSISSDVGESVEPVAKTQRGSDTVAISTMESPLSDVAAQEHPGNQFEPPPSIDQTDRSDVLAVIRQVFSDGQPRNRQDAIRQVAQALGYGRVGHRINDVLQTDLLTAVRRGILDKVEDELILLARSIADYDRDLLKRQFLAAIGRSWIERYDAIQNFCRWMGFRRTGQIIDETARSLVQGLLRESRLEADGPNLIRRSP